MACVATQVGPYTTRPHKGLHYERGLEKPAVSERAPIWKRLRADGCEWEVRAGTCKGEDDEKGRTVQESALNLESSTSSDPRAGSPSTPESWTGPMAYLTVPLPQRAPDGGDHYGRPGNANGQCGGGEA